MRAQIVQFWMRMTRRQRLSTPRTGWLPGTRRCWLPAHWPDLALTGGLATVFGGGNRWADGHRVTETYFRARAAQVADEWLWWPVVGGPEGIDLVGTEPGASRDGPPRLARARSPKFPHTGRPHSFGEPMPGRSSADGRTDLWPVPCDTLPRGRGGLFTRWLAARDRGSWLGDLANARVCVAGGGRRVGFSSLAPMRPG